MNSFIASILSYYKKIRDPIAARLQVFYKRVQAPYKASADAIEALEQKLIKTDIEPETSVTEPHWGFWLSGLVMVFIGYILFKGLDLIYLIITAFILSMALESIIGFFERMRGIGRGFAIGLSYFLLIVFLLAAVVIVFPFIFSQLADLTSSVLSRIAERRNMIQSEGLDTIIMNRNIPGQIKERILSGLYTEGESVGDTIQSAIVSNVDRLVSFGTTSIKDAGSVVVSIISSFFAVTMQLFFVIILSIFFSIEKMKVIHFMAQISGHTERTELVLMKLFRKLGFWLKGQVIIGICVFLLVWLGLAVISRFGIDIPNKFTLALISGMLEFIPYLGPLLGMIPAILIAVSLYGFKGFITIVILYTIVQQFENNILIPMVMSQTLGVSPLLIFICMFMGAALFGFLGILLAVPIAVIVSILYGTYRKI